MSTIFVIYVSTINIFKKGRNAYQVAPKPRYLVRSIKIETSKKSVEHFHFLPAESA